MKIKQKKDKYRKTKIIMKRNREKGKKTIQERIMIKKLIITLMKGQTTGKHANNETKRKKGKGKYENKEAK